VSKVGDSEGRKGGEGGRGKEGGRQGGSRVSGHKSSILELEIAAVLCM
jgi:hypothetical protein